MWVRLRRQTTAGLAASRGLWQCRACGGPAAIPPRQTERTVVTATPIRSAKPESDRRPAWQRYFVAVLAVAAASLATWLLRSVLSNTILIFYFGTVIFVSWFGGLGPGLLSAALSLALADFLFI